MASWLLAFFASLGFFSGCVACAVACAFQIQDFVAWVGIKDNYNWIHGALAHTPEQLGRKRQHFSPGTLVYLAVKGTLSLAPGRKECESQTPKRPTGVQAWGGPRTSLCSFRGMPSCRMRRCGLDAVAKVWPGPGFARNGLLLRFLLF